MILLISIFLHEKNLHHHTVFLLFFFWFCAKSLKWSVMGASREICHAFTSSEGLRPLYTTVEKCTGESRVLAQDMVIWGEGWYAGEAEKTIKYFIQVGVLRRSSFLSEALRLPKKLDLRITPLPKSVTMLASMYNALQQRTLDRSVNHHYYTRVSLLANQILEFP